MSGDTAVRRIVALHTPRLRAELAARRALRYATNPGSASGIASHVRAASAIRRLGSRLIVIQDDVNALALADASSGFKPLVLPPGADGHRSFDDTIGNKHLKMDLEAAVVLPDGRVLAFGSGSAEARESIVVVESETGVRVTSAQVADVIESDGTATALKLEGIEPRPGSSRVFDVVADMDRPDQPAWLAELRVGDGPESGPAGPLES